MTDSQILHASAVAWEGRGALICGPSGSGKSRLALELMVLGTALVADDMTVALEAGDAIRLSSPDSFRGLIEVRGVGLLGAECQPLATLKVVVDLAKREPRRLPPMRTTNVLGKPIPVIFGASSPGLAAPVLQYLKFGRVE